MDSVSDTEDTQQTRNAMLVADLRSAREVQHSLEKKIILLEQKIQENASEKYVRTIIEE